MTSTRFCLFRTIRVETHEIHTLTFCLLLTYLSHPDNLMTVKLTMWLLVAAALGDLPRSRGFVPSTRDHGCLNGVVLPEVLKNLNKKSVASKSAEEILELQTRAEREARKRHDNFVLNTLFVPVDEHSEPRSCSLTGRRTECWGKNHLPHDLPSGAILRIGPNGASSEDGWLDGDGMIQCVIISDDKGSPPMFSSTYVDTRGRSLERQASGDVKKRYRGTLGAAPKGLSLLKNVFQNSLDFKTHILQKDTCNTALARSGSRIMALMEQSPPSEIEITRNGRLRTVESMCRLEGAVEDAFLTGGSLGAHGRTDPESGERIHLSYNAVSKPYVRADVFDANWKLKSSIGIDVPAPIMLHDCAITKNYIVVMDFPLTVRPHRLAMDKFPVEYEPEQGARIGLVRRNGRDIGEVQWFDVSVGVVLHAASAFEREDGTVVLHGFKSVPKNEKSFILDYSTSFFHQWVLNPNTGAVLDDRCCNPEEVVEFPVVEERFVGSDPGCIYGVQVTSIGGPVYTSRRCVARWCCKIRHGRTKCG